MEYDFEGGYKCKTKTQLGGCDWSSDKHERTAFELSPEALKFAGIEKGDVPFLYNFEGHSASVVSDGRGASVAKTPPVLEAVIKAVWAAVSEQKQGDKEPTGETPVIETRTYAEATRAAFSGANFFIMVTKKCGIKDKTKMEVEVRFAPHLCCDDDPGDSRVHVSQP